MTTTYPHWIFDGSPIDDPAIFETKTGEKIGGGERAVRFLRALRHPKSTAPRRAFQLDPWQERIVRRIYGPRDADGFRIVKSVFMLLPRGNRKTSLSAALALLHTIGPERIPGGEAIFAAGDRTQAGIGFREAAGIIRTDRRLVNATTIYDAHNSAKKIIRNDDGTFLEIVSSDGARQNGRSISFLLADEIHVWKGDELWNVLMTGVDKLDNSLLVVATTAGRGQNNVAWRKIEDARKIARGDEHDPSILPILFETDKDADWRDEALWHRLNPGMAHGYPSLDGFRRHAKRAERDPGERESLLQLKLNVWLDQSTSPFVDMKVYDEGAAPIDLDRLNDEPCFVALDMSISTDLTAVVAAWRDPDDPERFIVLPHFFCPANALRARGDRDKVPYPLWAEQGFITPTPGDVIDYRAVVGCIRDLVERFNVAEIVYDRAYAMPVVLALQDEGIEATAMALDPKSQASGVAIMERAIGARKFQHGGHPVLRWNVANVSIFTGGSGLRTMHKGKSTDRIDGAFAAWMAVARAHAAEVFIPPYAGMSDADIAAIFA